MVSKMSDGGILKLKNSLDTGNILIIVAILTQNELNTTTNLLLVGMAAADSLNLVIMVFKVVSEV